MGRLGRGCTRLGRGCTSLGRGCTWRVEETQELAKQMYFSTKKG